MRYLILLLGLYAVVSVTATNVLHFNEYESEDLLPLIEDSSPQDESIDLLEEGSGDDPEDEEDDTLPLAEECDVEKCQLPDCRCSSTSIPEGIAPRDTPQFVITTFDGPVTTANIDNYREIFSDRRNRNQCPVGATFFVQHQYTNYELVNELYNRGFEIGLNSISSRPPVSYWAGATYDVLKEEIADQRGQMAHFAKIPKDEIKGVRMPFFQMAGNNSFQVMADFELTYDLSWNTNENIDPGLWPYTLDYASTQDCQVPSCPTASIPGIWVIPGISWIDLEGFTCITVDSCIHVPDRSDELAWYRFIVSNFERHYLGNRAPFAFFVREGYMNHFPAVKRAYERFYNLINGFNDVFMVNAQQVVDWVKDPVPLPEYLNVPCKTVEPTACDSNLCVLTSEHNNHAQAYWMTICDACPKTYPWVGNPFGL